MKLELSKDFQKSISRSIEQYEFEVGVLDDKPHRYPQSNSGILGNAPTSTYAGGPVRKASRANSGKTVGQVLTENMERLGKNILAEPFEKQNPEMAEFSKRFLDMAIAKKSKNRVINLLQAMVRNPILKGEYGSNSDYTESVKGFNRHLIDTAQMFKSIKARILNVRG